MRQFILLCILGTFQLLFAETVYFTTDPTLTPDAQKIVFSYEDDLWQVPVSGGTAYRITGMEGQETNPRISPDGRWLAFTGNQVGNNNLYVMPLEGGEIRQLTFHDGNDIVESWSWNSQWIYFTSDRYNNFSSYKVSVKGGTPVRIFEDFFNTPHNLIEDPIDGKFYFTESWESYWFANRKRYKGAYNPNIKSYNPKTAEYKEWTHYEGKDFWHSIDERGNFYFVSDEANGEYNLYTFRNGAKTQLTGFETSIKEPQVSANGGKVVFEKDYQIYNYDVATDSTELVNIQIFQNKTLGLSRDFNTKGEISFFDVSPDGKKIAFVSRGKLFVSDIKGKFIEEIPIQPNERVLEVKWLEDNLTLLYNQTVDGWLNYFTIPADGSGRSKQITDDSQNNRDLTISNDHKNAVYLSGRNEVRFMDLSSFKSETIIREELWGFYNSTPYFSPDDRYLVFTAYRDFEQDIFIHDLNEKETINLTKTGVTETDPFWSPDGKYLYFASDRFHPQYPRGSQSQKIYRFPLQKFDDAFRSAEFDSLFMEEEEKEAEDEKGDKDKSRPIVEINFENVLERFEQVSPDAGEQSQPFVIQQDQETAVLYISDHDKGKSALWKTVYEPFEKTRTDKMEGAETGELMVSGTDSKYYLLLKGDIHELNLDKNKLDKVDVDYAFTKDLQAEFNQMFHEMWANVKENFYDEEFHGVDCEKIKSEYRQFLPHLNSRANLRTLLNDMLGELNSSHLGFRSMGQEEETFHKMKSFQSGLIFEENDPFRVKRVIENTPFDKVDKNIQPGDELIAINGEKIDFNKNRESYFVAPSEKKEISLTFRRDNKEFDVRIHPQGSGDFKNALYDQWITNNQHYVDEKSDQRIAYVYMKNMGSESLEKFLIEMTSEGYHREALILDLRYNRGGNVHNNVLQFLSQQPYTKWKYRGGEFAPQPNFAPSSKPIVLLMNEQSLSDAEMTAAGFKALNLGKIIGTETYRWLIFTTGKRLVDGSYYRLPSWGCYTLDGKNIELNGVEPDIHVNRTFKDRLEDADPQLDRAIDEVLKALKKE